MSGITVMTPDPIVDKLLEYLASEILESIEPVILLDAAWMDRLPEFSGMKVILFSTSADPTYLTTAQKTEASGFWYLEPSAESLSRALMGPPTFPEKSPVVKLGKVQSSALTGREMDVLRQLVYSKTDAEIAEALNCAVPTVKHHIQQLRIKTGLSNRTQLAVAAVASGLVSIG